MSIDKAPIVNLRKCTIVASIESVCVWQHRMLESRKYLKNYPEHSVGDRFIPWRTTRAHPYHANETKSGAAEKKKKDILAQRPTDHCRLVYVRRLESAWRLGRADGRLLHFARQAAWARQCRHTVPPLATADWPVKPRRKAVISAAVAILDLPEFPVNFYHNLLDWGRCGRVAACLTDSVFLWDSDTEKVDVIMTLDAYTSGTAVKWNGQGDLLAVASNDSTIRIWDRVQRKTTLITWCYCKRNQLCTVNALAWHPTVPIFTSGCSNGLICVFGVPGPGRQSSEATGAFKGHVGQIGQLVSSPDGQHLASTGEDGFVNVWRWTDFRQSVLQIQVHIPCRALAWHPWHASLLAAGGVRASVWDVSRKCVVASYSSHTSSLVYSLAFSSITGEMVASFWVPDDNDGSSASSGGQGHILVLSSFQTVVDWLRYDITPTPRTWYLLWSPDGQQIAAAGNQESLAIWDFLGTTKASVPRRTQILGDINEPNNYGHCIR